MGNNHVIALEREAKLSLDTGRLCLQFVQEEKKYFFACSDIAVLLLAHPCISLTEPVLEGLSKENAVIVAVNEKFIPVSFTLPLGNNLQGAKRPHLQARNLYNDVSGHWWRQLVESKIRGQASVLKDVCPDISKKLCLMAEGVLPADPENREGSAAKVYWEEFFACLNRPDLTREKLGAADIVNVSLNYSYAIIRAAVARSLCAAGLCLNFGVGHCRKDNPFNLAEDFIEPFRFLADRTVLQVVTGEEEAFSSTLKKELLETLLSQTLTIENKTYRLFQGIDLAVYSFCVSLEDSRRRLWLPNMPVSSGARPVIPNLPFIHYE